MAIEEYPRHKIYRPHTSITVDTTALSGVAGSSDKPLMLIGQANSGKPNTVYKIRNISQAKRYFHSGELLDAIELAWTGAESATAGVIYAMRVEDAKEATLTKGGLKITSKLYGYLANNIKVALEDNTITDSKRLRVEFADGVSNIENVYDNLGNIFQIKYNGSEQTATYSVVTDKETGKATKLVLATGGTVDIDSVESTSATVVSDSGQLVKTYDLVNTFKDIVSLVQDINNLPDFEAKLSPFGDKNIDSVDLDKADNVDVVNKSVYVKGLIGDIKKQAEYDELINIETVPGEDIENFNLQPLTGGTNGDPVTSWAEKFSKFANEGGYYLVPLTDKASVHAEAGHFVKSRSDVGEPMRAIVGGGVAETKEKLLGRVASLQANPRVALVGSSGTFLMVDGRSMKAPGYLVASAIGGLASGLTIGEPITFKNLYLTDIDVILDGDELDQMTQNGIITIEYVRNRTATDFRIVDDVTVNNTNNDPVKAEMAVGEANDFLVSELKTALDRRFIGTKTFATSAGQIKDFLISFMNRKKRDSEILDFASEDIQVIVEGNTAQVALTVVPIRGFKRISVSLVYKQSQLRA
ncbi:tail sheath [Staphylococcus phage Alsa_3]|nr:tail sheath [Staphylococcus phage Alsa_3]WNM51163.1 tail sheath [Staphylococcus phage Alsa_4]